MRPTSEASDVLDCTYAHREFNCQFPLGCALREEASYFHHVFPGEDGLMVEFSQKWRVPALDQHVLDIISSGPGEKMDWSEAWRVVAMMTDIKAIRYWSNTEPVGLPMGTFSLFGAKESTVAVPSASRPFQAWIDIPWKSKVVRQFRKCLDQVFVTGNLVSHLRATSWRILLGPLLFSQRGPFVYFNPTTGWSHL